MYIENSNWDTLRNMMNNVSDIKEEAWYECSSPIEYSDCCDYLDCIVTDTIADNCVGNYIVLGRRMFSVSESITKCFALRLYDNWQRYINVLKTAGKEVAKLDYVFNLYGQYLRDRERVYRCEVGNHHLMAASQVVDEELTEVNFVKWRAFEKKMSLLDFLVKVGKYKAITVERPYVCGKNTYTVNYIYSKSNTLVGIHVNQGQFAKFVKGKWDLDVKKVANRLVKPDDMLLVLDSNENIVIMNVNEIKYTDHHEINHAQAIGFAASYKTVYLNVAKAIKNLSGIDPIVKYRMIFSEKFVDSNMNFNDFDKWHVNALATIDSEYIINKHFDINKYGLRPDGSGWVNGDAN